MAINCPGVCSQRYASGTSVQLTAAPDGTSEFIEWQETGTGVIKSGTSTNVDGTGTLFTTELSVNDVITASSQTRTVTQINSDTSIKINSQFSPTINTGVIFTIQRLSNPLTVVIHEDKPVTATFNAMPTLAISEAGSGTGVVTSDVGGINCPGTCSAQYATNTIVNLTATPDGTDVFAGWSGDVPAGHENDNPVAITMSSSKNVTATFNHNVSNGALFAHSGETSGATYDTTNKFGAISEIIAGGSVTGSSATNFQVRAPAAFTISFIYVQLVTALGSGKSITFKINVNGSTSNAISVTVSGNNTTGFSTNGPLAIAQDDLICIEAATFSGTTNGTVDHFAIGTVSDF